MPSINTNTLFLGNLFLSEREMRVFKLSADGYSNKQVAHQLSLSEDTIETHNRNIVYKLEAKNMKQAIAIGIRKRIIK